MLASDARLRFTEDWYRDFVIGNADAAERELVEMYAHHQPVLQSLRGRVLDVGGGAGLAARFLSSSVDYSVLDPSTVWHEPAVAELGRRIRQGGPVPRFINGVGEQLPFNDHDFDAVLAFWSLNHANSPYRCVTEIARVLRPGGLAYLVLEDMVPTWRELIGHALGRLGAHLGRDHRPAVGAPPVRIAIPAKLLRKWPLSPDHVAIDECLLIQAARPRLTLVERRWIGGYLTLTLRSQG